MRRPLGWLNRRDEMDSAEELSSTGLARCGHYSPLQTMTPVQEDDEFSSELPTLALDPGLKAAAACALPAPQSAPVDAAPAWVACAPTQRDLISVFAMSGWTFVAALALAAAIIYVFAK